MPTPPSSSSVRDGIVVVQPVRLGEEVRCPSSERHVIDRIVEDIRERLVRIAKHRGVTLADEPKVELVVRISANGYERQTGDGLADAEWEALVGAHGGRRPLAYVLPSAGVVDA